jgi:N-acetylmuramoyl-L-alanine amidase
MKIVIDPGHGGTDDGAAYGFAREADINLDIARLLRCVLDANGYGTAMTRDSDVYVALADRCNIANSIGADLFISVHCDAWHKQTTHGISTHIFRGANHMTWRFGKNIHRSLMNRFPDHVNRGLKQSNFMVLRETSMSAVLVECEFISNPGMREFLKDPEDQFALAYAIGRGVWLGEE